MSHPVFSKHEFMTGLDRLGENDVRKLLRGGALDGEEARWAIEWLARGPATQPAATTAAVTEHQSYAMAS